MRTEADRAAGRGMAATCMAMAVTGVLLHGDSLVGAAVGAVMALGGCATLVHCRRHRIELTGDSPFTLWGTIVMGVCLVILHAPLIAFRVLG